MNITRSDLLRILVLNEISDGYQAFEGINREARSVAARCGLVVTLREIIEALSALIGDGLVRAAWLSTREPAREIEGVPAEEDLSRVYFFQTERGKQVHAASYWPLDANGDVLPDLSIAPSS